MKEEASPIASDWKMPLHMIVARDLGQGVEIRQESTSRKRLSYRR